MPRSRTRTLAPSTATATRSLRRCSTTCSRRPISSGAASARSRRAAGASRPPIAISTRSCALPSSTFTSARAPRAAPAGAPPTDPAVLSIGDQRLAFTTDSYVVRPRFFPGGNIGDLAVHGTVNDLAMAGTRPSPRRPHSFPKRARTRGARSGGQRDGGCRDPGGNAARDRRHEGGRCRTGRRNVHHRRRGGDSASRRRCSARTGDPGDKLIVSGPIGLHGTAVLSVRESRRFGTDLRSDCAPLNGMVQSMPAAHPDLHVLRDLTRAAWRPLSTRSPRPPQSAFATPKPPCRPRLAHHQTASKRTTCGRGQRCAAHDRRAARGALRGADRRRPLRREADRSWSEIGAMLGVSNEQHSAGRSTQAVRWSIAATPGRSSNACRSALTTVRRKARAVAAIIRSCAPRGRPERRTDTRRSACSIATARS